MGPRADGARFVDQRDFGRMREPRQVARRRRHADADETDVLVAKRARSGHDHHLIGAIVGHRAHSAATRSAWMCLAKISGPRSSTLVFIQARQESRSRAIASQDWEKALSRA